MPLFSIITSTLNNLGGLKATAASLKSQKYQNFEWLVADGDSSDGTQAFLEDTDSLWLSQKDAGIYDAWNKIMGTALGDYLIFLPAGDRLFDENILDIYAQAITDFKRPDFIYGDALESFGEDCVYKKARPYRDIKNGIFTHVPAMVFHRRIINKLVFDTSYSVAADYKFLIEALRKAGPRVMYMPTPLCIYEAGGFSQINAAQGRQEQFDIRRELRVSGRLENSQIMLRQFMAWQLRTYFPKLFWWLKASKTVS